MPTNDPDILVALRLERTKLRLTVARLRAELADARARADAVGRAIREHRGDARDSGPVLHPNQSAGGFARSRMMSPEERSRVASLAAKARWSRAKAAAPSPTPTSPVRPKRRPPT